MKRFSSEESLSSVDDDAPLSDALLLESPRNGGVKSVGSLKEQLVNLRKKLELYEEPKTLDKFFFKITGFKIVYNESGLNQVKIPSHVLYVIRKSSSKKPTPNDSVFVYRRFNDFFLLSELLETEFTDILLPALPPKTKLKKTSKHFVKIRQIKLNIYLNSLLKSKAKDSKILKLFLYLSTEKWQDIVSQRIRSHRPSSMDLTKSAKTTLKTFNTSLKSYFSTKKTEAESTSPDKDAFLYSFNAFYGTKFALENGEKFTRGEIFTNTSLSYQKLVKRHGNQVKCFSNLKDFCEKLGMAQGKVDNTLGPQMLHTMVDFGRFFEQVSAALTSFTSSQLDADMATPSIPFAVFQAEQIFNGLPILAANAQKPLPYHGLGERGEERRQKELVREINRAQILTEVPLKKAIQEYVNSEIEKADGITKACESLLEELSFLEEEISTS